MKGESATPVVHHLFEFSENATKLSQADADIFHNVVAQLLYIYQSVIIPEDHYALIAMIA